MFKLLVLLSVAGLISGDAYYYNMREWVKPMLDQVKTGAKNGMDGTRPLLPALNIQTRDRNMQIAEKEIKAKIAEHLHRELGIILDEMQSLINIVVQFSLTMSKHLNSAIWTISREGDNTLEKTAENYLEEVVKNAHKSVQRIVQELDYKSKIDENSDHLSADVFQKLAIEIAREVLTKANKESVQRCIVDKIEHALTNLLADKDQEIDVNLGKDLTSDLTNLFGTRVDDEDFQLWMKELIADAVNGAKPQIGLLQSYAKSVISDACSLSHNVISNAYKYFEPRKESLGKVWDKMHATVTAIMEQQKEI